jgi:hypothetical protein
MTPSALSVMRELCASAVQERHPAPRLPQPKVAGTSLGWIEVVGWNLMLAGVAALILFLYFWHGGAAPAPVVRQPRGFDDTSQPPM